MRLSLALILAAAAATACTEAGDAPDETRVVAPAHAAAQEAAQETRNTGAHPPLGRYVCRQYMTTIGYITLTPETYSVGEVRGGYDYDPASGEIAWQGGAYGGWPARYEHRTAASLGRALPEEIIRMTDEEGRLKIDCFLMRD